MWVLRLVCQSAHENLCAKWHYTVLAVFRFMSPHAEPCSPWSAKLMPAKCNQATYCLDKCELCPWPVSACGNVAQLACTAALAMQVSQSKKASPQGCLDARGDESDRFRISALHHQERTKPCESRLACARLFVQLVMVPPR